MTEYQEKQLLNSVKRLEKIVLKQSEQLDSLYGLLKPVVPKSDNFLTVYQAAKKLQCCTAQITKMCREGKLPFATKVGKKWMLSDLELTKYIGNIR
ncbi:helix-turn-helix domain-containing protein [Bacteroides sp. 51]|uniref:helix-turn-helix domain-containing protein n=1 Tax=Bacteroides sp. 51 TaxID=2302938 RepID=UPI0013D2EBAF|nr:helix-turn-helix domain-containing protein [Bacteroides sp. 51]NDV82267.1 DNA-binding protein [Bacteroides sp. 51]